MVLHLVVSIINLDEALLWVLLAISCKVNVLLITRIAHVHTIRRDVIVREEIIILLTELLNLLLKLLNLRLSSRQVLLGGLQATTKDGVGVLACLGLLGEVGAALLGRLQLCLECAILRGHGF